MARKKKIKKKMHEKISDEKSAKPIRKNSRAKNTVHKTKSIFSKEELLKGARFALTLGVIFFALDYILSTQLEWIEHEIALAVSFILGIFGITSTVTAGEPALILVQGIPFPIAISYLCTGILETAVLAAAIAATLEIKARKRLIGIAAAIAGVQLFNIMRILATIAIILNFNLELAEIGHEILFRLFLFMAIAGFYAAWLWWANNSGKLMKVTGKMDEE